MYKALAKANVIPSDNIHKPHPHLFPQLQTRFDVYKYIYIPHTIVDWNALANNVFYGCKVAPEQLEHYSNNVRKKIYNVILGNAW